MHCLTAFRFNEEVCCIFIWQNRWEICLSMREQNEPRNSVKYTQRVFTKRRNCVNIAKCLVQNKWLFYVENGQDLN
jgi:hypothetical protein